MYYGRVIWASCALFEPFIFESASDLQDFVCRVSGCCYHGALEGGFTEHTGFRDEGLPKVRCQKKVGLQSVTHREFFMHSGHVGLVAGPNGLAYCSFCRFEVDFKRMSLL